MTQVCYVIYFVVVVSEVRSSGLMMIDDVGFELTSVALELTSVALPAVGDRYGCTSSIVPAPATSS